MNKNAPFPIRTSTSCLLKWNWATLWLTLGKTSSCHRNWKEPLPLENFDNFHNLPYRIDHRKSMLKGEWPHSPNHLGCGYCREIEEAGGRSDRQYMTDTQTDQTPHEVLDDPTATHVDPTVLEVFSNRTCNMACTYCTAFYSSKIQSDANNFKNPAFDDRWFSSSEKVQVLSQDEIAKYNQATLDWIARKGTCLRRFHMLGGEPFFQREFDDYINIWKEYPNPDLIFNVVSNMNVNENRFREKIDKIMELVQTKKIERFDLTASIDCWGPKQEYVRRGFDCKRTEKNIKYVLQYPEIRLNLNSTHSLMSLPAYVDLLNKKNEWEYEFNRSIYLYGMTVASDHVHPAMLGGDFFKDTFYTIRSKHPLKTWDDKQALRNIDGILKTIEQSEPNVEHIKNFVTVYNELDRRHNTDWKSVFPELANEISKHMQI